MHKRFAYYARTKLYSGFFAIEGITDMAGSLLLPAHTDRIYFDSPWHDHCIKVHTSTRSCSKK